MKTTLLYLCFSILGAAPFFAHSAMLEDSFESGDMSAASPGGFAWSANNSTSVVSMYAPCNEPNNPAPVAVYNNGVICNPGSGEWTAKTGIYSLRFSYGAGANWAEQRFDMGKAYRDLWIRFWLRVPLNYYHNDGPSSDNGKLLALWMDGYSNKGEGPTIVWNTELSGDGNTDVSISYGEGGTVTGGHRQFTRFINYPDDQGRWMQLVFHAKAATDNTSSDGVIQLWRRWDGENSFTKFHEILNANIASPPGGPDGWKLGYILGWVNATFTERTNFLIDDFTVSETSLLEINGLANPAPPSNVR